MDTPERHTYADRQAQKAAQMRAEFRERRQAALAKQRDRYEQKIKEQRADARAKERAAGDKVLAKQKAVFDTRMQRRNEGLRWRQARDGVEKNCCAADRKGGDRGQGRGREDHQRKPGQKRGDCAGRTGVQHRRSAGTV